MLLADGPHLLPALLILRLHEVELPDNQVQQLIEFNLSLVRAQMLARLRSGAGESLIFLGCAPGEGDVQTGAVGAAGRSIREIWLGAVVDACGFLLAVVTLHGEEQ